MHIRVTLEIEQIRAARAMLGLSQKQLALHAGIAVATLNNIERGAQTDPKSTTVHAIQRSLESQGIEFSNEEDGRVGVFFQPKRTFSNSKKVLIVDDNKGDRALYSNWLNKVSDKEYIIIEADSAETGLEAFLECQPDCIILDFMMYGADGFQLLARLKNEKTVLPPIIFVTGMHNDILEESALAQGVCTYLDKRNLQKDGLCEVVDIALRL